MPCDRSVSNTPDAGRRSVHVSPYATRSRTKLATTVQANPDATTPPSNSSVSPSSGQRAGDPGERDVTPQKPAVQLGGSNPNGNAQAPITIPNSVTLSMDCYNKIIEVSERHGEQFSKLQERWKEHLTCGICQEHAFQPQLIVECGHIFCANCISYQRNEALDSGRTMTCGVCRVKVWEAPAQFSALEDLVEEVAKLANIPRVNELMSRNQIWPRHRPPPNGYYWRT